MAFVDPAVARDLHDALEGLDRELVLGEIQMAEYTERCEEIAATLREHGIPVTLATDTTDLSRVS
jgi:hypothetical protein